MFCPKCSEPKAGDATQFCTKCGFDLTGLQGFVEGGGGRQFQRRKGIEQGAKLITLGVLLIPVWLFIGPAFPAGDRLVESSPSTTWLEQLAWILMWVSLLAGAARIAFAIMFEPKSIPLTNVDTAPSFETSRQNAALPAGDVFQPADPGRWKTTGELFEPIFSKSKTSGELR